MTKQQNTIPDSIRRFLYSLMMEKGVDTLPGSMQGDILYDLYVRYNQYIIANALKTLSVEQKEQFSKIIEGDPSEEDIQKFFEKNTDFAKITKETSEEFRGIYLGTKE